MQDDPDRIDYRCRGHPRQRPGIFRDEFGADRDPRSSISCAASFRPPSTCGLLTPTLSEIHHDWIRNTLRHFSNPLPDATGGDSAVFICFLFHNSVFLSPMTRSRPAVGLYTFRPWIQLNCTGGAAARRSEARSACPSTRSACMHKNSCDRAAFPERVRPATAHDSLKCRTIAA